MKYGVRTPNIKKRVKARTTGKIKRKVKKATTPTYGKKGTGIIKDPQKAIYNKVYNKTSVSVDDIFNQRAGHNQTDSYTNPASQNENSSGCLVINVILLLILAVFIIACIAFILFLFIY